MEGVFPTEGIGFAAGGFIGTKVGMTDTFVAEKVACGVLNGPGIPFSDILVGEEDIGWERRSLCHPADDSS